MRTLRLGLPPAPLRYQFSVNAAVTDRPVQIPPPLTPSCNTFLPLGTRLLRVPPVCLRNLRPGYIGDFPFFSYYLSSLVYLSSEYFIFGKNTPGYMADSLRGILAIVCVFLFYKGTPQPGLEELRLKFSGGKGIERIETGLQVCDSLAGSLRSFWPFRWHCSVKPVRKSPARYCWPGFTGRCQTAIITTTVSGSQGSIWPGPSALPGTSLPSTPCLRDRPATIWGLFIWTWAAAGNRVMPWRRPLPFWGHRRQGKSGRCLQQHGFAELYGRQI